MQQFSGTNMVYIAHQDPADSFRFSHHVGIRQFFQDFFQFVITQIQRFRQYLQIAHFTLPETVGQDLQNAQRMQQLC